MARSNSQPAHRCAAVVRFLAAVSSAVAVPWEPSGCPDLQLVLRTAVLKGSTMWDSRFEAFSCLSVQHAQLSRCEPRVLLDCQRPW